MRAGSLPVIPTHRSTASSSGTRRMTERSTPAASLMLALFLALAVSCTAPADTGAPHVVLNGAPVFAPDPAWPVLPAGWTWGQVIGIDADAGGHVWTSTFETGMLSEWNRQGDLVQSWDARGPAGNWRTAHGLFVDHGGYVWTTARESHLVNKFTRDGRHVRTIGRLDETGGSNDTERLGRPAEIWVDPATNEAFIADGYINRRIIVFDGETGRYLRHWGAYGARPPDRPAEESAGAGEGPSRQFGIVHGITGSRDGRLYVADRGNNRIQVFRRDGGFVAERILRPQCGPQEQADWTPARPCGSDGALSVALSSDEGQEYLYVADAGMHVIVVLRRSDLAILDEFGGLGVGPDQLGLPHNLTVDPDGNIYVAQAAGPDVPNPTGEGVVRAGFRAQKFAFRGTRPLP